MTGKKRAVRRLEGVQSSQVTEKTDGIETWRTGKKTNTSNYTLGNTKSLLYGSWQYS